MVDPEMLDPETGILAGASGVAELTCATDEVLDNAENARSANNAATNNLIAHPNLSLNQDLKLTTEN